MNFNAETYISGFSHTGGKISDLSRITTLLEILGNPHKNKKFVHIAGTNGKGSSLEYISRILISAGYKTGQFTSPFIESYNDRIRINGENINSRKLDEIALRVKNAVSSAENKYSQFEITLAIAFIYFKEEKCDIVFLETGIGGLLDATNVIDTPLLAVITSVSLDHTQLLGSTVSEIAAQKAGIIKKNCPVILSADNTADTVDIVKNKTEQCRGRLIIPDPEKLHSVKSDISGSTFWYGTEEYSISMCGKHQIINALTALESAEVLKNCGFDIQDKDIKNGLLSAKVKLRTEILNLSPLAVVDGGHNISGIDSLIQVLESVEEPIIGAVGMIKGKAADYAGKKLSEIFDSVICADGFIENNINAAELMTYFTCPCEAYDYKTAVKRAFELAKKKNAAVVMCGSLYFASAARKVFFEEELI